jgi:hypothetical protein
MGADGDDSYDFAGSDNGSPDSQPETVIDGVDSRGRNVGKRNGSGAPPDKRKKQVLGATRPDGLRESKEVATQQPMLSPLLEPRQPFYDTQLTFERMYAARCIEGVMYQCRGPGPDGVGAFMRNQLVDQLIGMMAIRAENELVSNYLEWEYLGENRDDISVQNIEVRLPQLQHLHGRHTIPCAEEVELHDGKLLTKAGDQFAPSANGQPSVNMPFDIGGLSYELSLESRAGVMRLTLDVEDEPEATSEVDAEPAMVDLFLSPSTWLWKDVLEARREHGSDKADALNQVNPMDVQLLLCCLRDSPERWAEYLRIVANGRFKAVPGVNERGGETLALRHCCETTNLWAPDVGGAAYRELESRVQLNASLLSVHPASFKRLFEATKEAGFLTSAESATDPLGIAAKLQSKDRFGGKPFVFDRRCFEHKVLDTTFVYDAKKLLGFSNGICYDVMAGHARPIVPEDGMTLTTGYDYQPFDKAKDDELEGYLTEIIPNKAVRTYDVGLTARCLLMEQTGGIIQLSNGRGGGGKGVKTELKKAAFGKVTLTLNPHPHIRSPNPRPPALTLSPSRPPALSPS